MSNIMNMKDVRNHVHRSGFDLSRRNCFTAKVGEILPVMCEEVLPGDRWRIDIREFMRTAPVQTASFGRVRQYYDFYFVPYSLLWDKFDAWVMQTKNAYHSKSLVAPADEFTSQPYMLMSDYLSFLTRYEQDSSTSYPGLYFDGSGVLDMVNSDSTVWSPSYYTIAKLLSYLGYPLNQSVGLSEDLAINPFPLLAYQKIYQDYFRFSQWEDAAPWTYNLDYVLSENQLRIDVENSISQYFASSNPTMFTLRYCSYDKDYFNGLLPSPQYGDTAIAGPLSGTIPGQLEMFLDNRFESASDVPLVFRPQQVSGRQITLQGSSNSGRSRVTQDAYLHVNSQSELYSSGISVLLLRQAEALQKWKEITLSGSPDFKEQLEKHWNVRISKDNSYLCRYLGGMASDIDISEVINTNLDAENSEASIAGKGISAANGHIEFDSHQYGLIMCVYHAKPVIEWEFTSVMPRLLTKTKATDYAIPEFDNIGMQSVIRGEFLYNAATGWSEPIGFAPRYIEYKTSFDRANGAFNTTLSPWIIPHALSATANGGPLTYKSFKVGAGDLDNMFGVKANSTYDTDQFYNTAYIKASVVRNLSRDGLPY